MTLFVYKAGNKVNYVDSSGGFTAQAIAYDAAGAVVKNKLITFSTGGFSNLSLANQSVTSNEFTGVASVVVSPSTTSSGGGVSLTASATVVDGVATSAPQLDLNVAAGSASTASPTLSVDVYKASDLNTKVYAVSYSEAYVVRATLTDASGAVVPNTLVSFDMGAYTNAIVSPASLVTNTSGVATVSLAPASISAVGGGTVKASATVGGASVTNQTSFNVAATNVSLGAIVVGDGTPAAASLASAGNTSLALTVSVGTPSVVASGVPIAVAYSASCGRINGSSLSASTTTNGSGVANASYEAVNSDGTLCSGTVSLTATSAGATSVVKTLTVAAATANAITFVSTGTASQIFVTGSGALEQYVAKFKVLSGVVPMSNQSVTFSLLVNPGGVGLGSTGSTTNVVGTTNITGDVEVSIFAGTLPGSVKVRAALTLTPLVFAETQNLTVASGPASQRFMSLSVEKFNIEGWAIDGTTTKLTARVADRQGNAVADGTVVNFTAESGQVAYSCSTKQVNLISSCSVDFQSQNPRTADGRVSVLAFLEGTADYTDTSGNNRYDAGTDTLVKIGDAYRDDNENGIYDPGEFVITRGGSVACASVGRPFPSRLDTCDTSLATTVRQQAVILYSSSTPTLVVTTPISKSGISFTLNSFDNSLLPMPAGTTVTAQASGQSISGGSTVSCSVDKVFGGTVANVTPGLLGVNLGTQHTVTLKDCVSSAAVNALSINSVAVTIKAPSGLETIFTYVIP